MVIQAQGTTADGTVTCNLNSVQKGDVLKVINGAGYTTYAWAFAISAGKV